MAKALAAFALSDLSDFYFAFFARSFNRDRYGSAFDGLFLLDYRYHRGRFHFLPALPLLAQKESGEIGSYARI